MAKSAYLTWLARALTADTLPPSAPTAPAAEDMVMGYATGYGPAEIAPFVRSLRTVFAGPVALVVDQEPALLAFLKQHDVEALSSRGNKSPGWKPHAVVERFAEFAELLAARPWIRNVLLTDIRDVIFQAPPFEPPLDRLEFFDEYDGHPLADHAFDTKHITAVVGEDFAHALRDKACVCVGTVIGPREIIIQFCKTILLLGAIPRSAVGGAFGADQATCNIVAHLGLLDSVIRPNYGRIATIGLTDPARLSLQDDKILNPDGSASPIVHQYDRHPLFADYVNQRWRSDLRAVSRNEKTLGTRLRRARESFSRRRPEPR